MPSLFWNVYREAFLRTNRASRLVFLRRGWGVLHERLAAYFEARGGTIRRRALAESIEVRDGRAAGVRYVQRAETREDIRKGRRAEPAHAEADVVVAAVPWHALPGLLPEPWPDEAPFAGLRALGSSPIVSIELWLDRVAVDKTMVGLRDSEVEWVFDKGRLFGRAGPPQHLAFIVSAAVRSSVRPNAELALLAETALRALLPGHGGGRGHALPRDARGGGNVLVRARGRGGAVRPGHAPSRTLRRRRLDEHGPARHHRGCGAQRPGRGRRGRPRGQNPTFLMTKRGSMRMTVMTSCQMAGA